MTSEGLGEVFKGDSADMRAGKFPLVLMGENILTFGVICNFPKEKNYWGKL